MNMVQGDITGLEVDTIEAVTFVCFSEGFPEVSRTTMDSEESAL
jgi:hypothetical protein